MAEKAEEWGETLWVASLDMEKAFDRCSWTYLHEALRKIVFNGSQGGTSSAKVFIDYIKLFYNHEQPGSSHCHGQQAVGEKGTNCATDGRWATLIRELFEGVRK